MNFKISAKQDKESLNLFLQGDFDGSSAQELLYTLRNLSTESKHIVVKTENLNRLLPFGLNVFRYNLGVLKERAERFLFTGKYGASLAEAWPKPVRPIYESPEDQEHPACG